MFRILFLLLIVMTAAAFAQTGETPKARKFDEFQMATYSAVAARMSGFFAELNNNPEAQGIIINYGTDREITMRERQIKASFGCCNYDAARMTLVSGGFRQELNTELWVVPAGAENPKPSSNAELFDEFGKTADEDIKARVQNLYVELGSSPNLRGYIVQSGSTKAIATSEGRIKKIIAYWKLDASRVIFKKAGQSEELKIQIWLVTAEETQKPKTEIWIIPPGAKPPTRVN